MAGLLMHLSAREENCAKCLIATHFHELFNDAPQGDDILQACQSSMDYRKMDVIVANDSVGSLSFLYRCIPGKSLRSLGYYCASLAGIPEAVVLRGMYIISYHIQIANPS